MVEENSRREKTWCEFKLSVLTKAAAIPAGQRRTRTQNESKRYI
jgi:hypothetical protein